MHSGISPTKLGASLLSASSACLCCVLQSAPHYSSALPSPESREPAVHQPFPSACITFSWYSATYPPPACPPACPVPPSAPLSLVIREQSLVLFSVSAEPCSGIQIGKKKKKNFGLIQMYTQISISHTRLASHE